MRWFTFAYLITFATFLMISCAPPAQPAVEPAAEIEALSAETNITITDGITHSVPLEDIYFDTFRSFNRAVSYPDASSKQIADLLDAIPPIHSPKYESADAATWLAQDDMILGYVAGKEAWAYPLNILNYHEIVNDTLGGEPILISYCPLCFSGIIFSREVAGQTLQFGNTSALYESDMVMVDYETGSYWWQVAGSAIVGEFTGSTMAIRPSQTATWGEWVAAHPETVVLSRDTGFERDYSRDAFATYADSLNRGGRFAFPVSNATQLEVQRGGIDPATRTLSVKANDEAHGYLLTGKSRAIMDKLANESIVVFVDGVRETGAVFSAETHTFMRDERGFYDVETESRWSPAGLAVSGPLAGTQLDPLPSRVSFWFAIISAEPDLQLVP